MRRTIKNLCEEIIWLIKVGLKTLKIKIFSYLKEDYSDPYRLLIKVSSVCNYRCAMCGNWKAKEEIFIPEKKQKEIIEKFKNKLFFLSITGGEPFLQEKKLFQFVTNIKKQNPNLRYISINTNGSRPVEIKWFAQKLLTKFPKLNLYVGLHYIPNKKWGIKETGVPKAYSNYKKTKKLVEKLEKKFQRKFSLFKTRFRFYNIITISKKEDFQFIKKEKDLWLGFAIISTQFYNNIENNYIEKIKDTEKEEMLSKFLKLNKKKMGFLNKKCAKNMKKIFQQKKRKRKCYAGINRMYIDPNGEIFICSRGLKTRAKMNQNMCTNCWTSCEANFDLLADFFLPAILNRHQKDIKK